MLFCNPSAKYCTRLSPMGLLERLIVVSVYVDVQIEFRLFRQMFSVRERKISKNRIFVVY